MNKNKSWSLLVLLRSDFGAWWLRAPESAPKLLIRLEGVGRAAGYWHDRPGKRRIKPQQIWVYYSLVTVRRAPQPFTAPGPW